MRAFLLIAFVLICATAILLWRDERTVSIEALLALPLVVAAWRSSRPSGTPHQRRRLVVAGSLVVIVVANVALLALGTIPWYAALLAAPLLLFGWQELRRPDEHEAAPATTTPVA